VLALALWLNRHSIRADDGPEEVELNFAAEWLLVAVHVGALVAWNFREYRYLDIYADIAITMVILPAIAVAAGRFWPYLVVLPITAIPIAGKTLRQLCYREEGIGELEGWLIYVAAPLVITTAVALVFARRTAVTRDARSFLRWTLLLATWLYFTLNFAFFHFPWPWDEWTNRTPNGIIFAVCAFGLTALALLGNRGSPADSRETVEVSAPGVTGQ
jgi:nitroreductase